MLHRQVGRLIAFKDAIDCRAPARRYGLRSECSSSLTTPGRRANSPLLSSISGTALQQKVEFAELFGLVNEECAGTNHEPARSQLDQLCEDSIEVTFGAGSQDMELQPQGTGCCLHVLRGGLGKSGISLG